MVYQMGTSMWRKMNKNKIFYALVYTYNHLRFTVCHVEGETNNTFTISLSESLEADTVGSTDLHCVLLWWHLFQKKTCSNDQLRSLCGLHSEIMIYAILDFSQVPKMTFVMIARLINPWLRSLWLLSWI